MREKLLENLKQQNGCYIDIKISIVPIFGKIILFENNY